MQKITIILFLATIFGCSNPSTKAPDTSKTVTVTYPIKPLLKISEGEIDSAGTDVRISIVEQSENDTAKLYKALSSYEGKEVGLLIAVPKAKEGNKGFGKGIVLKTVGYPSDNLLHVLSQIYKQKVDTSFRFVDQLTLNYVNLKEFAKSVTGDEGQPYTAASEYKLFFEGKGDDDYAELFLNINTQENWIELAEKDEEYRPYLLQFLKH